MKLYHGSNVEVKNPMILESTRPLDFGNGFYLTSSLEQAKRWAKSTVTRRKSGKPLVSVFEINSNDLKKLNILEFNFPDEKWLDFVVINRRGMQLSDDFDVIIGPVANDNTQPVISLYIDKTVTKEIALELLLPQKLKDQVVFKNEKSLKYLKYKETIQYEK